MALGVGSCFFLLVFYALEGEFAEFIPKLCTDKIQIKRHDVSSGKKVCCPGSETYNETSCKVCSNDKYGTECNESCKCTGSDSCNPTNGNCYQDKRRKKLSKRFIYVDSSYNEDNYQTNQKAVNDLYDTANRAVKQIFGIDDEDDTDVAQPNNLILIIALASVLPICFILTVIAIAVVCWHLQKKRNRENNALGRMMGTASVEHNVLGNTMGPANVESIAAAGRVQVKVEHVNTKENIVPVPIEATNCTKVNKNRSPELENPRCQNKKGTTSAQKALVHSEKQVMYEKLHTYEVLRKTEVTNQYKEQEESYDVPQLYEDAEHYEAQNFYETPSLYEALKTGEEEEKC